MQEPFLLLFLSAQNSRNALLLSVIFELLQYIYSLLFVTTDPQSSLVTVMFSRCFRTSQYWVFIMLCVMESWKLSPSARCLNLWRKKKWFTFAVIWLYFFLFFLALPSCFLIIMNKAMWERWIMRPFSFVFRPPLLLVKLILELLLFFFTACSGITKHSLFRCNDLIQTEMCNFLNAF